MTIAALVLAGGRGSRLGASVPKPLVRLAGRTLLERVLAAIPDGIGPIILNANEGDGFEAFGLTVLPDVRPGFAGPLAGIETAARSGLLEAAATTHLLVLPGDTPFLTHEVLDPLIVAPGPLPQVARYEGHLQPAVALWPLSRLAGLSAFLDEPRKHAIRSYLDRTGFAAIDLEGDDPFFNVNTPMDLDAAERRLAQR